MKTLSFSLLVVLSGLSSGCASIIAAQLKGKLPPIAAKELSVSVSVVGVGGGTIAAKGITNEGGILKAAEFHEQINTGGGSLKIDGTEVEIGSLAK